MRAHVASDLLKVIRDLQRGTVEAYDLLRDPGEAANLGGDSPRVREALGVLDAYFETHRFRRDGYVEPFRAF